MADLKPTLEQEAIIDAGVNGDTFVVDAVAGSGKTSTLRMASQAMADSKILYLVYNRAAADDARKVFPKNVTVKTTAAMAFGAYKGTYGDRILGPRVPANQTAAMLGLTKPLELGRDIFFRPYSLAVWVIEAVDRFCHTADLVVEAHHVPPLPLGLDVLQEETLKQEIVHWANKLWRDSQNPTSKHRFTFDYAFKRWVMDEPSVFFDTIMLDEAQDSNGIVEHFIKQQYVQKVIVGDPAQQLYAWRGAVNIMDRFEGERLSLSQSWRFGEAIAAEADKWLAHTGTGIKVKGNPAMDSVVADEFFGQPDAVLCRTNATAVDRAMFYLSQGLNVAVAGGTKQLVALAYAAGELKQGKETTHQELIAFKTWKELVDFTEEPGGGDLKALVNLIQIHGVGGILDACKLLVDENKGNPDVTVSTAHKSKGREWMNVEVAADFKPPHGVPDPFGGEPTPGPIPKADAMLHYVTVTRARQLLGRGGLTWIDDYEGVVIDKW